MNKEFIPYQEALALKELGFDEECFGHYRHKDSATHNPITIGIITSQYDIDTEINGGDEYHNYEGAIFLAPLYQQAFRWFREKYGLYTRIEKNYPKERGWNYRIHPNAPFLTQGKGQAYSYEQAELDCLRKLTEIIKERKK